jgi:hypothetical protein
MKEVWKRDLKRLLIEGRHSSLAADASGGIASWQVSGVMLWRLCYGADERLP